MSSATTCMTASRPTRRPRFPATSSAPSSAASVANNVIGSDPSGKPPLGNQYGIHLSYSYGMDISSNVISSNMYGGIFMSYDAYYYGSGSTIRGNLIGTNASGNAALGTQNIGIALNYPYGTTVANNTISGHLNSGIDLLNGSGVTVKDNRIGTTDSATAALPNSFGL